ncbi:LamG domain-containing protein [Thermoproteota archaeon]
MSNQKKSLDDVAAEGRRYQTKVFIVLGVILIIILAAGAYLGMLVKDYVSEIEIEDIMPQPRDRVTQDSYTNNPQFIVSYEIKNQSTITYDRGYNFTEFSTKKYEFLGTDIFDDKEKGTIAAWVKHDGVPGSIYTVISSASTTNYDSFFAVRLRDVGENNISDFRLNVGSRKPQNWVIGNTTIDTEWHHIAVTSDGNKWRIYVDGKEEAVNVNIGINQGDWWSSADDHANAYLLGTTLRARVAKNYFKGLMRWVHIDHRTLSPEEIDYMYRNDLARLSYAKAVRPGEQINCIDSDGDDIFVKGNTTGCQDPACTKYVEREDCCMTEITTNRFTGCRPIGEGVLEFKCGTGDYSKVVSAPFILCPQDHTCVDGACVPI